MSSRRDEDDESGGASNQDELPGCLPTPAPVADSRMLALQRAHPALRRRVGSVG